MTDQALCRFFNLGKTALCETAITLATSGLPTLYLYDDRTGRVFERQSAYPEPDGTFIYNQVPSRRVSLPQAGSAGTQSPQPAASPDTFQL